MLRLYSTLSRKREKFVPISGKRVLLYTCGPSVYNFSHIGNFRAYLVWDVLKRHLRYSGFRVRHVMNITDVEDKAVKMARNEGEGLFEFEREKEGRFFSDSRALGIIRPEVVAPVSKNMPAIIALIRKLVAKKFAYIAKDGVYFSLKKFPRYGELSGFDRKIMRAGRTRLDDYDRRSVRDFVLWKFTNEKPNWESPWGRGRPGWHIECSAIATKYLGEQIDVHCGGVDNIFPHHENEIAQSEGASGKRPFAKYWLHCKHLTIGKKKMSKRTGNVKYVNELIGHEGMTATCLRFVLLSKGYRHKLDFTEKKADEGMEFCRKFTLCMRKLDGAASRKGLEKGDAGTRGIVVGKGEAGTKAIVAKYKLRFEHAMDSDLDTGRALQELVSLVHELNLKADRMSAQEAKFAIREVRKLGWVLGIEPN